MRAFEIQKNNKNLNIKIAISDNSYLKKYIDFDYYTGLCRDGCPNFNTNWTCPPNSPTFEEYTKNFEKSLILIMYCDVEDDELTNIHQKLRKNISPIIYHLENKVNGKLTDGGRCINCDSCTCIDNLPCRFPHLLRYSLESMGVNLDALSKEILDHSILWNNNTDGDNYCTVFGSVLFNGDYSELDFEKYIKEL